MRYTQCFLGDAIFCFCFFLLNPFPHGGTVDRDLVRMVCAWNVSDHFHYVALQ